MQAKSDLLVDSDEKENLLAAAAELSDATTELLAAAKVHKGHFRDHCYFFSRLGNLINLMLKKSSN